MTTYTISKNSDAAVRLAIIQRINKALLISLRHIERARAIAEREVAADADTRDR